MVCRISRQFAAKRYPFRLWRLDDSEYTQLRMQSFPIKINTLIPTLLEIEDRGQPDALNLPRALLALEAEFGQSSTYLDSRKQTFSFPFLLAIERTAQPFYYLLKICDYRGGIDFSLNRLADREDFLEQSLEGCREPIEDELSKEDIEYLIAFLWGYLGAIARRISNTEPIQPFIRYVDSNHIIYGYCNGEFFEREIDDLDQYEKEVAELDARYGQPPPTNTEKLQQVQAFIHSITTDDTEYCQNKTRWIS